MRKLCLSLSTKEHFRCAKNKIVWAQSTLVKEIKKINFQRISMWCFTQNGGLQNLYFITLSLSLAKQIRIHQMQEYLIWRSHMALVWPDWAIYWTLGNFLKSLATINLPKSLTFLGNFSKGVKSNHFCSEIIFRQLL